MLTISVQLNRQTADDLRRIAAQQGTTVAALIEALGRALAELLDDGPDLPEDTALDLASTIATARLIAAERRARAPEPET